MSVLEATETVQSRELIWNCPTSFSLLFVMDKPSSSAVYFCEQKVDYQKHYT